MAIISLDEAYEIAGGYKKVDEQTFLEALSMVREDDPIFANSLEEAHKIELRRQSWQEKKDKKQPQANTIKSNTNFLDAEYIKSEYCDSLLEDEEIVEALKNTPIIETAPGEDENGNPKEAYILEGEEREKHINMLVENAKLDVACDLIDSNELAEENSLEGKKEIFRRELKTSFLSTLANLRLSAQLENNVPNAAQAVRDNNEEFFSDQQEDLANMIPQDRACDFSQRIGVSVDSVIACCSETKSKAERVAERFKAFTRKISGSSKKHFENAANFVSKVKDTFVNTGKTLWGQRFEFANNLKDRAPKIITDISATATLCAAATLNAPWIGTAAIAYGAYKAASAWMWPIVTKARQEARLAKEDKNTPKLKFWQRLKKASNDIFNNKDERKAYYKEAGWGTAAGLVGLGAAGAVLSGAVTIGTQAAGVASGVVARSFQSLSTLAVHSVNSTMNAVRTVKSKKTNALTKVLVVGGAVLTSYLLYKCCGNAENLADTSALKPTPSGKTTTALDSLFNNELQQDTLSNSALPQDTLSNNVLSSNALQQDTLSNNVIPQDTLSNNVIPQDTLSNNTLPQDTIVGKEPTLEISSTDTEALNSVIEDKIEVPTEWNNSTMGITKAQWTKLQTYWENSPQKFASFYSKIDNNMLKDGGIFEGMTREQVLFKYERISSWNLPAHQSTLEKLDQFFRDCDNGQPITFDENDREVLNSVLKNGAIRDVEGKDCVMVLNRMGNDCGDQSTLVTVKVDCGCDEAATQADKIIPTQSTPITFEEAPATQSSETTKINISLVKSNNLHGGDIVNTETPTEDATLSAQTRKIKIEQGSATTTDVTAEGQGVSTTTEVTAEGQGATATKEVTTEGQGATATKEVTAEGQGATATKEVTTEGQGATATKDVELNNSITHSEIIEGTENVEQGTPAAGNIEARGGYQNSGITPKQYNNMQTFFKNSYGENAYEEFASRITDDMRAKGGIFEGLSVEQSMFSIQKMIAWSNDQTGAFADEITNMVNYLKECDDVILATDAQDIKAIIDSVNENGTIDGVTGTSSTMVRFFQTGPCGEAGTYGLETGASGVTKPSGDGFSRFFKRTWIETPTPIFEEDAPTQSFEYEEINVSLNKGNNLVFGEQIDTVSYEEAILEAGKRKIRIEVDNNSR